MLFFALALTIHLRGSPPEGEARARWHCEPAEVALGEPFELVLELEHPASLSAQALAPGALTLDDSWVVISEQPLATESVSGGLRTRRTFRVASLEPGERALGEVLSGMALAESVKHIQVGEARVTVRGILAEGEDQPRGLAEFQDDYADARPSTVSSRWFLWSSLVALPLLAGAAFWLVRRRRRGVAPQVTSPLERLAELERAPSREGCYELTRLLRAAGDELRNKPRGALTDEEWLAEAHASLEIPRGVVSELAAVFERAARVKYAGDAPTAWALQETFARARAALQALRGGGVLA